MSHMNLAVLWIRGEDEELSALLAKVAYTPAKNWRKGDARGLRGTHQSSGFSIVIADSNYPGEMMEKVRAFLADCISRNVDFVANGLSAEFSIGVTVGSDPQFIVSVDLKTEDLTLLGSIGIALSICAYPSADDGERSCAP